MRLEPNEREWIQIPGTGNSTAIFGSRFAYVGSNGNLIMHNFPVDNNTSGDTFPAGTLSIRKLSGSTSELWLTSKGGDLFRFIYAQTQYLVDGTHKVVDLAISNRVYIINEEGHVCSRSFTEMDWVCTSNIPEGVKFSLITASASMIYVMAENGTVYATSIPLVAGIGFYPTGYTIPGDPPGSLSLLMAPTHQTHLLSVVTMAPSTTPFALPLLSTASEHRPPSHQLSPLPLQLLFQQ
ncbi:hypothetical protein BC829DRAFT_202376 [Chytridium lagenaria]|nr:hypothetical protein BC829DRAFT_202376 [Chytridium lagenaria]